MNSKFYIFCDFGFKNLQIFLKLNKISFRIAALEIRLKTGFLTHFNSKI